MPNPIALLVEDVPEHADLAAMLLSEVGFEVHIATSLPIGVALARSLLDVRHPPRPALVLLDIYLPHVRCPPLEGTALAAHLLDAMERRLLHPAHVVGISCDLTPQRDQELRAVGCSHLLEKPLTASHARMLRARVERPPTFGPPREGQGDKDARWWAILRNTVRRSADQLLSLMQHASMIDAQAGDVQASVPTITWDSDHVSRLLLQPEQLLSEEPWGYWVRCHGGMQAVRRRLLAEVRSNSAHELLELLIAGKTAPHWQELLDRLHLSRSAYYRRRQNLLVTLAGVLNSWNDPPAPQEFLASPPA